LFLSLILSSNQSSFLGSLLIIDNLLFFDELFKNLCEFKPILLRDIFNIKFLLVGFDLILDTKRIQSSLLSSISLSLKFCFFFSFFFLSEFFSLFLSLSSLQVSSSLLLLFLLLLSLECLCFSSSLLSLSFFVNFLIGFTLIGLVL